MVDEVLEMLALESSGVVVDMTLGGGGHSQAILNAMQQSSILIGLDRDQQAIDHASPRLSGDSRFLARRASFAQLGEALEELGHPGVDGVLMDLGVSSHQLDEKGRGFSFRGDGPLDMRMDRNQELTAAHLISEKSETELADIIYRFGEERKSRRIARAIVERRKRNPIRTTGELSELVAEVVGHQERKHPATRTFQALRIAVNGEMEQVESGLNQAVEHLNEDGRVVVISYHSLEDRLVKSTFNRGTGRCICPRELPVCQCNPKKELKVLTRKPMRPTEREIQKNPRARSARLRCARKLGPT